jgi:hypothetical protein
VEGGADGGEEDVGAAPPHHGAQPFDVSRQAHREALLHTEQSRETHREIHESLLPKAHFVKTTRKLEIHVLDLHDLKPVFLRTGMI